MFISFCFYALDKYADYFLWLIVIIFVFMAQQQNAKHGVWIEVVIRCFSEVLLRLDCVML